MNLRFIHSHAPPLSRTNPSRGVPSMLIFSPFVAGGNPSLLPSAQHQNSFWPQANSRELLHYLKPHAGPVGDRIQNLSAGFRDSPPHSSGIWTVTALPTHALVKHLRDPATGKGVPIASSASSAPEVRHNTQEGKEVAFPDTQQEMHCHICSFKMNLERFSARPLF